MSIALPRKLVYTWRHRTHAHGFISIVSNNLPKRTIYTFTHILFQNDINAIIYYEQNSRGFL